MLLLKVKLLVVLSKANIVLIIAHTYMNKTKVLHIKNPIDTLKPYDQISLKTLKGTNLNRVSSPQQLKIKHYPLHSNSLM